MSIMTSSRKDVPESSLLWILTYASAYAGLLLASLWCLWSMGVTLVPGEGWVWQELSTIDWLIALAIFAGTGLLGYGLTSGLHRRNYRAAPVTAGK